MQRRSRRKKIVSYASSNLESIVIVNDGAEICELVDLFILHQLSQFVDVKNISLHRDNGLAILKNASGPTSERLKKKIIKLFIPSARLKTLKPIPTSFKPISSMLPST